MALDEYFEALRQYDSPTVCNSIELFGVRPNESGFMGGDIKAQFPEMPPAVGYATTATFRSAKPASEEDAYSNILEHVDQLLQLPSPRVVVFQDIDETPCGATFGEVMCTIYKAYGCEGLITSGGARDLDQVRALGFPCWAASVIVSHANCRIVDLHVPVEVGGCRVEPGDVIHADCNGVTTIPKDIVPQVTLGCKLLVEAEEVLLNFARNCNGQVDGLREAHKECRALFASIRERVWSEIGE